MEKTTLIRHIIGYVVGISIFGIIIPWCFIKFSSGESTRLEISLISNSTLRLILGLIFLIIGLLFAIWSNIFLLVIGKGGPADGFNVALSPRTKKLVIVGPYKYSRNPMVFGAYMAYISIGIFYNSISCLILLFVFFWLTIFYLKMTEEKRLFKDFGNEFLEYKKKVPMIIPFTKRTYIS